MTPNALYTFVTCNKFGIREKLYEEENIQGDETEDIYENIQEDENLYKNKNIDRDKSKSMSISDSSLNESNVWL